MAQETPKLAKKRPPIITCTGLTILFFVLLRISIGWHLAYEGCWKLRQDHWTADSYLLASTGPLRPLFLKLVPDSDARERLTQENILERMDDRARRAIAHYKLTDDQIEIFDIFLERKKYGLRDEQNVRTIFQSESFQDALNDYHTARAILEIAPEGRPPVGMEVSAGTAECLTNLNACRDDIAATFEPLLTDLDKQVKAGHDLAIERAETALRRKLEDMKQSLKDAEPDDRGDIEQRVTTLEANLAEMGKRLEEDMEEKGELSPPPPIKPANLPDPDDLSWLTQGYVNGVIHARYDNVLLPYYYFNSIEGGHRKSSLDTEAARTRYGELVARELVKTFEESHQSIYGWRYREQKKIGDERDPNNIAFLFEKAAFQWQKDNTHESEWEDPAEDILQAAEMAKLSDFELAVMDYFYLLKQIEDLERAGATTRQGGAFTQERLLDMYVKKNTAKNALLERLEVPYNDLDPARMETFTEEMFMDLDVQDQMQVGPVPRKPDTLISKFVNWGNMLGLTIAGVCLMLGLFTRLSAVVGAGLVALYYMAMPPWPGLPESPMSEGHYFIVNKNLIEMIALLMIASSRVGRWFGLDAIIHAILVGLSGGGRSKAPKTEAS